MCDHAVDVLVIGVGGHIGAGEHVLGVEDVEALVLHRSHVEVAHRDDHVVVQVHLEAEALLVPGHAQLERGHGVPALVELARLHVDRAAHAATAGGDEPVLEHVEFGGDAGEEIRRLGEGVFPGGPMAAAGQFAGTDRVAVGEQLREVRLVRLQPAGELRHYVWAVGVVGDAAEALCLALGEIAVLAAVEAGEGGVLVWLDADHGGDARGVAGQRQAQALVAEGVRRCFQRDAVHRDRDQRHRLAVEPQRRGRHLGIAAHLQLGGDLRMVVEDGDCQADGVDPPRGRGVLVEVDGDGGFGAHVQLWGLSGEQMSAGVSGVSLAFVGLTRPVFEVSRVQTAGSADCSADAAAARAAARSAASRSIVARDSGVSRLMRPSALSR